MSPSAKPSIGFVGLGLMGYGMATNLVKAGYQVYGYDISSSALDRFQKDGGHACQTLSESTKNVDYYVCMVASAPQVQSVVFDGEDAIVKTLRRGAVFILNSTVPASYAQSVQDQFNKLGREDIYLIDSPVSGGAARAAAGTLTLMVGGSEKAIEKGEWLLKEMSAPDKLFITGGIGAGSNMKMAHQVLAGIQILAASEVMGFASKLGVDPRVVRDEVCKSEGWSWMFENRVPRMLEEDYFPGMSALTIILKDVVSTIFRACRISPLLIAASHHHCFMNNSSPRKRGSNFKFKALVFNLPPHHNLSGVIVQISSIHSHPEPN
jgi:3-hydroxyisobutyrate dehydrogenase